MHTFFPLTVKDEVTENAIHNLHYFT